MPLKLPKLTRRRFLRSAGALVASIGVAGVYAWRVEPHWLCIVERDLPIDDLPDSWVGRTIVQISDLHVGTVVDPDHLTAALRVVSGLRPDMVVVTGDFMSCRGPEQIDAVASVMGNLELPALGCYAILGNHDYGLNWSRPDVADSLVARLSSLGIRTLRNESATIDGLQLVGLDDLWGPNFRPEAMLPKVDWGSAALTLCHNPDAVDLPTLAEVRGWVLSGHTHGGQCKPPFLAPPLLPVKNARYTRGEFDVGNGRRLYINPGLGYLRRVRFGVRPEITAFRLVRA